MTERRFKNKHTGEQAVLLRIETLDDLKRTRVYVLNDVGKSRWNESLLFEHWDEITEPQNESTMPATPEEHQEKRILP